MQFRHILKSGRYGYRLRNANYDRVYVSPKWYKQPVFEVKVFEVKVL